MQDFEVKNFRSNPGLPGIILVIMNCMKYYKFTQYVWLKMQDFEVKNAKIFWGGHSPPQTPPTNEEGDTPSSNSSPQCREGSNFLSFIPPPPENPGSVTDP